MTSPAALENLLRDLPAHGTLLKSRPYREVWRFEFVGKPYILKFYPRRAGILKRLIRGSPAMREFLRLQMLQRAGIPSPRVVAQLSGYLLKGVKGDAVVLESIEPAVQLDQYLNNLLLRGDPIPRHHQLALKLIHLVNQLGLAKLGHEDLHLGNILLKEDQLYLLDGYAVRPGGLRMRDVLMLAHSVSRFATRADLARGWELLGQGAEPPRKNPVRQRHWRKFIESTTRENAYFGNFRGNDGWSGHFYKHCNFPRRWAPVSVHDVTREDWEREWPHLLARVQADQFEILKRSESGDVLAGEIVLGGRPVSVVIKRSKRRKWYRYITEIGRGARRAWKKGWSLVVRDIPTAWPLLVMERRTLGYVTDSVLITERVRGPLLAERKFDELSAQARQDLFRRLGRGLRQMEALGVAQYDAKSANWIIIQDEKRGPVPVVIDVDGIRRFVPTMWPMQRLLMTMRENTAYTPADSRELCLGYAPFAQLVQEHAPAEEQVEN